MLVFIAQKLVFLATPKTGTTAIETAMDPWADTVFRTPSGLKHTNIKRFNWFYRKAFESHANGDIETVCVVREPVDWLGSWYRYRSREQLHGRPNSTSHVSFDEFVETYMSKDRPSWAQVGDQAKFTQPNPDGPAITHLFQYEQMDKLVTFLQDRFQREITLPQVNVSPKSQLTLDPKLDSKLRRKCADQFDLWHSARR